MLRREGDDRIGRKSLSTPAEVKWRRLGHRPQDDWDRSCGRSRRTT